MEEVFLVTGAAGHLGLTIVKMLVDMGKSVRVLIRKNNFKEKFLPKGIKVFYGDVTDKNSMRDFFDVPDSSKRYLIHCAGIVNISSKYDQKVYDTNVLGTRNIVDMCIEYKIDKLVYTSSVHAIPDAPKNEIIKEITNFDPNNVYGLYAKTKAMATKYVLEAGNRGLDVSVVHPSGIMGPNDYGHGHLTQLIIDCYKGKLKAGVDGGYDFVDVRDVAQGTISCVYKGKNRECYLLTNHYYKICDIFKMIHNITGKKEITTYLPLWFAKLTAPLSEVYYRILKQPPLYTSYSLYTLSVNANFSNKKAQDILNYSPRPIENTIKDTIDFLKDSGRI